MGNKESVTPSYINQSQILQGSVVLLTGASSGLGKQLAIKLSNLSIQLIITGRNTQRLEQTKNICENNKTAKITVYQGDITNENICKQLIQKIIQKYGRLDILILNAGINAHFVFNQIKDVNVFEKLMKTNFYANVYLTKYALKYLRRSKGNIVVISSMSGKLGLPERSAYCASKFALTGFFQSLRTEQQDISICMVYPTSLDTPMRDNDILGAKHKDNKSKNKQQSAEKTAEFIIANISKGQKDLYIPFKMWMANVLYPIFPSLIRNKAKEQAKL